MGEGRYRTLLCLVQLAVPDGTRQASGSSSSTRSSRTSTARRWRTCSPTRESRWSCTPGARTSRWCAGAFSTEVRNVFDTQVAAGFAGMGAQASYDTLLSELLGVRVAKSASFTRWDARPLSPEQLAYAREDVVHLLELAAELERRLAETGRLEWAREECEPLQLASDERDLETIFARLPRVRGLSASAQTIARELVRWREQTRRHARTARCRASSATRRWWRSPSAGPPRKRELEQIRGVSRAACAAADGTCSRPYARGSERPPRTPRAGRAPTRARPGRRPAGRARGGAGARARARGGARLRAAGRARRPAGDRRRATR